MPYQITVKDERGRAYPYTVMTGDDQEYDTKFYFLLANKVPRDVIRDAVARRHETDLSRHRTTIATVADTFGLHVFHPDVLVIDSILGSVENSRRTYQNEIYHPIFFCPRILERDELALQGFYAHELAHFATKDDPLVHKIDLRWSEICHFGARNPEEARSFMRLHFRVERLVDEYAASHGFAEAIAAARVIAPRIVGKRRRAELKKQGLL